MLAWQPGPLGGQARKTKRGVSPSLWPGHFITEAFQHSGGILGHGVGNGKPPRGER